MIIKVKDIEGIHLHSILENTFLGRRLWKLKIDTPQEPVVLYYVNYEHARDEYNRLVRKCYEFVNDENNHKNSTFMVRQERAHSI